eukprot:TRINITY_DN13632_c0_g6_i1.p1 TRINITY_DN13632_c0_g6~~TRINITY_DN13632_c0_g6_i1.p1  ORF type:complete len:941 (+),score=72.71 TRINITY_DN13632_c0_g6_i1:2-2824(+)
MRLVTILFTLSLCWRVEARFDKIYAIDVASVVCPVPKKPTTLPAGMDASQWPTKQEYVFKIDYDHTMEKDQPHVVTILRPSGTFDTTVKFEVHDATGKTVTFKEVTLEGSGKNARAATSCECTGINDGVNASLYGADYGKTCASWDNSACDFLYPNVDMGPWCCSPWCYVDQSCSDAYQSNLAPGLFWSYQGACKNVASASPCKWKAPDPCECINVDTTAPYTSANVTKFGKGYGSGCNSWDYAWCDKMYTPAEQDYWCCSSWCWVDKSCRTALPSKIWPGLSWSDAKCEDNVAFVNQCPYKFSLAAGQTKSIGTVAKDPACNCKGYRPSGLAKDNRNFPAAYGAQCAAHDKDKCKTWFPHENHEIWCCQSWCYVDEACSTANPSIILPGWFWSYEACDDDGSTLAFCSHSDACKPTGVNTGLKTGVYPSNYGKACGAHDATKCSEYWSGDSIWNTTDRQWCCDSWAFINQSCPIAVEFNGSMASSSSSKLYVGYEVCSDTSASVYNNATNACQAPSGGRLLSARRRSRSYSSRRRSPSRASDTSRRRWVAPPRRRSPRRRAAPPRRRAVTPRRRAPAPPVAQIQGRRRAPASTPRRRAATPRRRAPPSPPPSPPPPGPIRRRAAPSPSPSASPSPVSTPAATPRRRVSTPRRRASQPRRRRTSTPPRRRAVADIRRRRTVTYPRRRTTETRRRSYESSPDAHRRRYSYHGRQDLVTSYGGTLPKKSSYGYTGTGQKKGSNMKLVMAGAAGLAAGAALGVGGYYLYNKMSAGQWSGSGTYADQSWCQVPSGPSQGRTMECADCYRSYGSKCKSENGCFSSNGCDYTAQTDLNRDDIMTGGFIPQEYTPPLTVSITKVSGDDYKSSKVCPATPTAGTTFDSTWVQGNSVNVDLYMTLTQVENVGSTGLGNGKASASGSVSSAQGILVFPLSLAVLLLAIRR